MEIAATGNHNVFFFGPPGAGKTLLARTLPTIMPEMTNDETLEVTKIYSVAGLLPTDLPVINFRPFRAPHHTTSNVALVGGGTYPRPGEITLAHRGVLFMDEFAEFPRSVLEALRQPLEDGIVTITRAAGSVTFPARFILIAASNPCPCGYLGHPKKSCKCNLGQIVKYKKKISGPLLDRIDIHVDVTPVQIGELGDGQKLQTSSEIRQMVTAARIRQLKRFKGFPIKTNAEMTPVEVKKYCRLTNQALDILKLAFARLSLSARSYFKLIKIAQTIADLKADDEIKPEYMTTAIQFRVK